MKTRFFQLMLCLALMAGSFASAQDRQSEVDNIRRNATGWFNVSNSDGQDSQMATDVNQVVNSVLDGGRNVVLIVSAESSSDGQAWYGISWAGKFYAFPMTAEQTRQLELEAGAVRIGEGSRFGDVQGRQIAKIDGVTYDNQEALSGDKPISGGIPVTFHEGLPANLYLRITYKLKDTTTSEYKPVREVPADGVLRFETGAINEDLAQPHLGPLPIFVDLCVIPGGDFSNTIEVVSDSWGRLLDIKAPQPAADFPSPFEVPSAPGGDLIPPSPFETPFPKPSFDSLFPQPENDPLESSAASNLEPATEVPAVVNNPLPTQVDPRELAWTMGDKIAGAVAAHNQRLEQPVVYEMFFGARDLARNVGVQLPRLPEGVSVESSREYLVRVEQDLSGAIAHNYGPEAAAIFQLGMIWQRLWIEYETASDTDKTQMAENVRTLGRRANLPQRLWEDFAFAIESGSNWKTVNKLGLELHYNVKYHLLASN